MCVVLADIHWPENVEKAEYKDHATQDLVVAWGYKMVMTCPVSTQILTSCHVCLAGYSGYLRSPKVARSLRMQLSKIANEDQVHLFQITIMSRKDSRK